SVLTTGGCGDPGTETESGAANNPLADEQQLIQDAKSVEDLLNKDAEAKKKALEEAN
ncbi:MAG: hypothetical protein HUJ31_00850, partial [Pseudomonadales bacterium]|nr:hypothetical protein [Pseudomonadales bacterium]